MAAYYDGFNYPAYWVGREYEQRSEVIAITSFLHKIKRIDRLLDLGSGYGRLTPYYLDRAQKIFLADSSAKLLSLASSKIKSKKIKYIHTSLENVNKKLGDNVDLVIIVRVFHHIKNIKKSIISINKILNRNGYAIVEFANKLNLKSVIKELLSGNFTIFYDIFPKDIRSKKSIHNHTIGFNNYHPGYILEMMKNSGFRIIEVRSVSNVRSKVLKKYIPLKFLCAFETFLQTFLSHIFFGPSTFVLIQKK